MIGAHCTDSISGLQPPALEKKPSWRDAPLEAYQARADVPSGPKLVLLALARQWAWKGRPDCWPANATIAQAVGLSIGHVRRCLKRLKDDGMLRVEPGTNPTGRRLVLPWREAVFLPDRARASEAPPARQATPAPARTEAVMGSNPTKTTVVHGGSRPAFTGRDAFVREVSDLVRQLPGQPILVDRAASRLATLLGDSTDFGRLGLRKHVVAPVAEGRASPDLLLCCLRQALIKGGRKPAALFHSTWKKERGG